MTTKQRRLLLEYLDQTDRVALLLAIIEDRKMQQDQQPDSDLLVSALDALAADLAGEDPGDRLAPIGDLCRNHPNPAIRVAASGVLARCAPTSSVVALLIERRTDERTPEVMAAVEATLDAVAETLADIVATTMGEERVRALRLLQDVNPARALPYARRLLDEQVEDPAHRIVAIQIIGSHGNDSDVHRLKTTADSEPNPNAQEVLVHAIRQLEIGDIADAHLRLGELAGVDLEPWGRLDASEIWGDKQGSLVEAMRRINKHQVNGDRESTVDQLGAELAKLVLFHTIVVAGQALNISRQDRAAIADNTMPYGDLVKRPQLALEWAFVGSLNELYKLRREHLSPQGTWEPHKPLDNDEYQLAHFLFKRGAGPCLALLAKAQQPESC